VLPLKKGQFLEGINPRWLRPCQLLEDILPSHLVDACVRPAAGLCKWLSSSIQQSMTANNLFKFSMCKIDNFSWTVREIKWNEISICLPWNIRFRMCFTNHDYRANKYRPKEAWVIMTVIHDHVPVKIKHSSDCTNRRNVRAEWLQSLSSSKTDSRCIKMMISFNYTVYTINKRSKSMYTSFCES